MNCRKGDLAYIVGHGYYGHFVTVLRWMPDGSQSLPDGYPCVGGGWLVEKASGFFDAPLERGGRRRTKHGVLEDKWLRPIRPGEGDDETLTWAGKPEGVSA